MDTLYDVVIAGAGPVGLLLACELALAGRTVLILERDSDPYNEWKVLPLGMRGLNTPSVEALYRRGLLEKFFDPVAREATMKEGASFGGHFAGIMIKGSYLDLKRWKYRLPSSSLSPGPTTLEKVQSILTERAESLGVEIIHGSAVDDIVSQDAEKVVVSTTDSKRYQGRWLVGCDGGRSAVRAAIGAELTGTEAKITCYALHAELENGDMLKRGFVHTETGMYITIKGGDDGFLYLVDYDGGAFDRRTQELSKEHLQEVLSRVTCIPDIMIRSVKLSTSFTDRSKISSKYREGRVLLAGDALHIHPPFGAQGLNLGLGDAFNLGWKLASIIEKEAKGVKVDTSLLDTYEKERRPMAEAVVEYTRAQVVTTQPDLYGAAIMKMVKSVIDTPDGANLYMDRFWGLSQRYPPDDESAHPLVGRSAPDFELNDGRLGIKFSKGQALFIDFEDDAANYKQLLDKYEGIEYHSTSAKDTRDLGALLIRPDGYVAWAKDVGQDRDEARLQEALERWFGFGEAMH